MNSEKIHTTNYFDTLYRSSRRYESSVRDDSDAKRQSQNSR